MNEPATVATPVAPSVASRRLLGANRSRLAPVELLACGLALGAIALAMCASHIPRGGFYYDDWSVLALGRFPPPGGLLHGLWLYYAQRPGQVLYYAALDELLGVHAPLRLALSAAMLVAETTCLYALLRRVGMAVQEAAALSLVFPFSDSVWLWAIPSLASLALAVSLLGVILALRALESSGARALLLHFASLALFVASLLSYEVFALAGCLAGLLYVRAVGFARARARWTLDVLTIALTLAVARVALPIDIATPSHTQSLAGMLVHAGEILSAGVQVAGEAALPVSGLSPWVGVALLAVVLAGAVLTRIYASAGDPLRAELGRWLSIAAAGALIAVVAWGVYAPASSHYSPTAPSTVNRMNLGAAIGIVLLLYSCVALLACMLARMARLSKATTAIGVTAAVLALGIAYVGRTRTDARAWDTAAADQRRLLRDLHTALSRLPRDRTLYVFDMPRLVAPGIPVLNTTLDLTSAVRMSYSSPRIVGVPVAGATSVRCARAGVIAAGVGSTYGAAYLVDIGAGRAVSLSSRAGCAAATAGIPGGR